MTKYKAVLGACLALLGAVTTYYGITSDSLTSWQALGDLAYNVISNPYALTLAAGAVFAYIKKSKEGDA